MSELRELIRKIKGDCSETCGALDIDQAISVIKSEFMKAVGEDRTNKEMLMCLPKKGDTYDILFKRAKIVSKMDGYNQRGNEIKEKIKEM